MYKKPKEETIIKTLEVATKGIKIPKGKEAEITTEILDVLSVVKNYGPFNSWNEIPGREEIISILTSGNLIKAGKDSKIYISKKGDRILREFIKGGFKPSYDIKFSVDVLKYIQEKAGELLPESTKESYYAKARLTSDILYLSQIKARTKGFKEIDKKTVEESIDEIKKEIGKYKPNLPLLEVILSYLRPLKHSIAIIIPNKDRFGRKFNKEFYDLLTEETYSFLEELCGGARIYEKITGLWRDPSSGRQFKEENKIVFAYTDDVSSKIETLLDYLYGLKVKANQAAVMYEINGKAFFL